MQESHSTCIKRVDGKLGCSFCDSYVVKNGKSSVGNQRYYCKKCKHSQVESYRYKSYESRVDRDIVVLTKEGCGIRSIGRILDISPVTVLRRILKISKKVSRPYLIYFGKSYQVDELFTYIGRKENRICIAYSIEEKTGNVIDFVVGRRNKTNLRKVISTLVLSDAKKITTDKLNIYKKLIPKGIHSTKFRGINKIERNNLDLRTHLKRLNKRTICFSKSIVVLNAIMKIYFWG